MGQLSIVYLFFLQLKHLLFFINRDVSTSKFQKVGVIVPQSGFNKREKDVLLLDIVSAREELVTALGETLVVVCTVIKDLAFFLI